MPAAAAAVYIESYMSMTTYDYIYTFSHICKDSLCASTGQHQPVLHECVANVTVCCSVLECVAAFCSALQCIAVRCGPLWGSTGLQRPLPQIHREAL